MVFSDSLISRIAELAADLTPVSEIAVLVDVPEDDLRLELADVSSPVRMAYYRAKAETANALRHQEIALARLGSPLAVQLTDGYLRDMTADEDC